MAKSTFLIQKEYELSIWEEKQEYYSSKDETDQSYQGLLTAIKEHQVVRIGYDGMDSPARAYNIQLKRNINGTNTLTFNLQSRYFDPDDIYNNFSSDTNSVYKKFTLENIYINNPFVDYLKNETRLKLKFDNEWYDFVIKDIQQDSNNYIYTYTAQDLYVNELARSGYDIELNTELENNMGTSNELGEAIVAGTDWRIEGEPIKQYLEEPLYETTAAGGTYWKNLETNTWECFNETTIYIFYSCIINNDPLLQCLKLKEGETELKYNSHNLIINADLYAFGTYNSETDNYIYPVTYTNNRPEGVLTETASLNLLPGIKGKRLVRSKSVVYDKELNRNVDRICYKNNENAYYYEDVYYQKEMLISNILGYNNNFTKIDRGDGLGKQIIGWYTSEEQALDVNKDNNLVLKTLPNVQETISASNISVYTTDSENIKKGSVLACVIKAEEFNNFYTQYENSQLHLQIKQDELFHTIGDFYLYGIGDKDSWSRGEYIKFDPFIKYENDEKIHRELQNYVQNICEDKYGLVFFCEIKENIAKNAFNKAQLSLTFDIPQIDENLLEEQTVLVLENIELFPLTIFWSLEEYEYIPNLLTPNEEIPPSSLLNNISITRYNVFEYKEDNSKKYLYSSLNPVQFNPEETYFIYDSSFAKVTTVEGKESNRFNLIQNINEKFECWAKFNIEHDEKTGKILTEKAYIGFDEKGKIQYYSEPREDRIQGERQKKSITFLETIVPQKNTVGFKYGVNLNSIQRTINSDQISTFVIVKNNNNEFAQNGFCSIARATENYSGENNIINFDYYIQMGMIDKDAIYNDLYVHNPSEGHIGYYYSLKQLNIELDRITNLITKDTTIIDEVNSKYEALKMEYSAQYNKYIETLNEYQVKYGKNSNTSFDINDEKSYPEFSLKSEDTYIDSVKKMVDKIRQLYKDSTFLKEDMDRNLEEYNSRKDSYENLLNQFDQVVKEKNLIINKFYSKYRRFIQEGTWIDETYTDDNQYYLDALSTARTSAYPQISYTISGADISVFEGYEEYEFLLGQLTTIEDTNFFGYDSYGLPNQEEVVISEITYHLDSPDNNELVVQNYRTQWEDLFQRVAAEVQSLQYAEGTYARAASIIGSNGDIKVSSLQSTIENNNLTIKNAANQSVIWDDRGITVSSKTNADKILRIVSDGIYISADGGSSYFNAIKGDGISASVLNAGIINTELITITNGQAPSFHWDSYGISAFKNSSTETVDEYDLTTFVRFDQFGLYGIKNKEVDWHPTTLSEIVNEAHFSITWDGFSLKTGDNSGIKITPENHFVIYEYIKDENDNLIYNDEGEITYLNKLSIGAFQEQRSYKNDNGEEYQYLINYYGIKIDNDGIIQLSQTTNTDIKDSEDNVTDIIINKKVLTLTPETELSINLDTSNNYIAEMMGIINIHDSTSKNSLPVYAVGPTGVTKGKYFYSGTGYGLESTTGQETLDYGFIHSGKGGAFGLGTKEIIVDGYKINTVNLEVSSGLDSDFSLSLQRELKGYTSGPIDLEGKSFCYGVNQGGKGEEYFIFPNLLNICSYNGEFYFNKLVKQEESDNLFDNNELAGIHIKDLTIETPKNEGDNSSYIINISSNKGISFCQKQEKNDENNNTTTDYKKIATIGNNTDIHQAKADIVYSRRKTVIAGHGHFKNFYRGGKLRTGCFWYATEQEE